jgi:hypothetical protein
MNPPPPNTFFFQDHVVGSLKEEIPMTGGAFRYEPFRGVGHLNLQKELNEKGIAHCYRNLDGAMIEFSVAQNPKYGTLSVEPTNSPNEA